MLGRLRRILRRPDHVIHEWEWYARRHLSRRVPHPLGDEWNDPAMIGMDVSAAEILEHLDRVLIEPCVGAVESVLEIGSGGGRFTELLARRAKRVYATDTSPTMLRILRKRFSSNPVVVIRRLDGIGLSEFSDASVSAVFSYDVFVHLDAWRTYAYLEEMHRILRPGGRVVLHHANTFSPLGWRRFLRDLERWQSGEPEQARFMPMTPELMRGLAERAGLVVHRAITDLVRRDCITLASRPAGRGGVT